MDEIRPSPSPPPPSTTPTKRREEEQSVLSHMKKGCLSFAVSLQESFRNIKATVVGQAKQITARNEKEAAAAELQAEKMQVEAADEAEKAKKRLEKSM
ncbi:hypothetical protein Tsubulata_009592 [Turnera subulata]|uniref:Uncharacterized protein n=1 Tax=Turnera subulata TaxID=218843 RepID=A0A9Q0GLB0_9ROSI|nr:hypothetical protein Tsubulata_009592 [Turnera subulata]